MSAHGLRETTVRFFDDDIRYGFLQQEGLTLFRYEHTGTETGNAQSACADIGIAPDHQGIAFGTQYVFCVIQVDDQSDVIPFHADRIESPGAAMSHHDDAIVAFHFMTYLPVIMAFGDHGGKGEVLVYRFEEVGAGVGGVDDKCLRVGVFLILRLVNALPRRHEEGKRGMQS